MIQEDHNALYGQGAVLQTCRHLPHIDHDAYPSPVKHDYWQDHDARYTINKIGRFAYCLEHPPLPGTSLQDEKSTFEIIEQIRVRSGGGAQIVRLKNGLAAKIFDPVFYIDPDQDYYEDVVCPVKMADQDYIKETAVYNAMDARYGGNVIPKFHGSFSMEIPVDEIEHKTRSVRLVVMEYIDGKSMQQICDEYDKNDKVNKSQWLRYVNSLIIADTTFYMASIHLEDLWPRNVMITRGRNRRSHRLVLIDFAAAKFGVDVQEHSQMLAKEYGWKADDNVYYDVQGRPVSPILRYEWRSHLAYAFATVVFPFDNTSKGEDAWSRWLLATYKGSSQFAKITLRSMLIWLNGRRGSQVLLKTELMKDFSVGELRRAQVMAEEELTWLPGMN